MTSDAPKSSLDGTGKAPLRHWVRPAIASMCLSGLWAFWSNPAASTAELTQPSASRAASIALEHRGVMAKPQAIRWIDPPQERRGWLMGTHRFVALGGRRGEPNDVWLGSARLTPEGRWLRLTTLHNISDTTAADEKSLQVSRERVAWAVTNAGETVSIQVIDMKGFNLSSAGDLTWLERWQTRLTFLQETGQLSGLCRRGYRLESPRADVHIAWTPSGLEVNANRRLGILRCDDATIDSGITVEPSELGSPGELINWAVDRVRALPWFGSERMQWLKAVTFDVFDRFDAVKHRVMRSNEPNRSEREMGASWSTGAARASDPETGWPPTPIQPLLTPALEGEGVFRPLDNDPFAVPSSGGPSPFAVAFLRPDPLRPESQIFIVLWDPRLVELHTMTGTREPKTATGETGSGTVPRDDETIGRFAAAFNGGFQATHGEFGMMAQRIVYLPPKPYAATIAELSDGTLGMGTWPDDETIAESMVGFRQNLTPLIADASINPYRRTWWGGVPAGWQDATRTVRTGLCLSKENFVGYFYGASISADHLAKAMQIARCDYGVHLDMNPGHTGFEFYRTARTGSLPPIQRKLDNTWETRGTVAGTTGWDFIGRRLLRSMHLMHFPRYVRTDSRDFFYLTHRSILPPSAGARGRETPNADDWRWRTHEQHGFPPAVASRRLHPDRNRPELEITLMVFDGKWLRACRNNCDDSTRIARFAHVTSHQNTGIYLLDRRFIATSATPPADAVPIAFGRDEVSASRAVAALGIAHGDWLFYAEVTRGGDRLRDLVQLKGVLQDAGANSHIYLEHSLDVDLGSNAPGGTRPGELALLRNDAPMAARLFRDTAVVAPAVWQPLQAKRVRYVRQRSASATAAPGAEGAPPANPEPSPPRDPETPGH